VRSLLREHRLSKELFSLGLAELGPDKIVEMVGLIGHYCTISAVANAFEVTLRKGAKLFDRVGIEASRIGRLTSQSQIMIVNRTGADT
jgi:hypothetical protein